LHIFREGNSCADKLASFGTSAQGLVWWDLIPSFIREDFFHNRYGLPFLGSDEWFGAGSCSPPHPPFVILYIYFNIFSWYVV